MLYSACDSSYKEQTNLMQAFTWLSAIDRDVESPNNLMSVRLSEFAFKILKAFFFPIPNKLLTESQPVIKWTTGRSSTKKPSWSVISWIGRYHIFTPMPDFNQILSIDSRHGIF